MRMIRPHEGDVWPPKHAVGDSAINDGISVENVELTEPHSHIFRGYTSRGNYGTVNGDTALQFHEPNRVDFEIESKHAFGTVKKYPSVNVSVPNPEAKESKVKHLVAGGIAGCVASTLTCPLDVIKTRQQSSCHAQGMLSSRSTYLPKLGRSSLRSMNDTRQRNEFMNQSRRMQMSQVTTVRGPYVDKLVANRGVNLVLNSSILQHYRYIVRVEGVMSLWKGLGPTLVGVVPSRAIYFYTYSAAKKSFAGSELVPFTKNDSGLHLMSAATAGFFCTTATSPLWVVKTKLQLHRSVNGAMTVRRCCENILKANGIRGFYRGISASYAGILETVLHFVIYEKLKLHYQQKQQIENFGDDKRWLDYGALMVIAAVSKTTATSVAYPHEVVRTRLREETRQKKYRGFFQTLVTVARQEGLRALYRGLGTQMIRQVPNMAIVMGTYELIIDAL